MSLLRVGMAEADDRCWVTVEGQLDRHTSQRLREHLVAVANRGCRGLLVDLRKTTFIDSSALSVLVAAMESIEQLGGDLVLRAPPDDVYHSGRVRRLGELVAIVDEAVDEANALNRLSRLFAPEEQGPQPEFRILVTDEPGTEDSARGPRW